MRLPAGRWKIIFVIGLERRFAEFIEQSLAPTVRPWLEPFSAFFFVFPHRISLTEQLFWVVCCGGCNLHALIVVQD